MRKIDIQSEQELFCVYYLLRTETHTEAAVVAHFKI
jgi:hypothetical protein